MGTTQSAVARLERPGANPSFMTLKRALAATGHGLELNARRERASVDESLILRNLKLTPTQRLEAFQAAYGQAREIALAGASARGQVA
jgi:transcriptional regulator with XRE-family HTH domain